MGKVGDARDGFRFVDVDSLCQMLAEIWLSFEFVQLSTSVVYSPGLNHPFFNGAAGMRFSTYHGHFMLRSSDLMALPAVDCDKAFAMELMLEDSLLSTQTVYLQVALLYTSSTGERRIRIHTMAAPVVNELSELYRAADVGAIASLLSRLGEFVFCSLLLLNLDFDLVLV